MTSKNTKCRSERKTAKFFVEFVFLAASKCNEQTEQRKSMFVWKKRVDIFVRHSFLFCLLICLFLRLLSLRACCFQDFASLLFFAYVDRFDPSLKYPRPSRWPQQPSLHIRVNHWTSVPNGRMTTISLASLSFILYIGFELYQRRMRLPHRCPLQGAVPVEIFSNFPRQNIAIPKMKS